MSDYDKPLELYGLRLAYALGVALGGLLYALGGVVMVAATTVAGLVIAHGLYVWRRP